MKRTLERYPIVLASHNVQSLEIEATRFVCHDWRRGNFLGYAGLSRGIRFAGDPASQHFGSTWCLPDNAHPIVQIDESCTSPIEDRAGRAYFRAFPRDSG